MARRRASGVVRLLDPGTATQGRLREHRDAEPAALARLGLAAVGRWSDDLALAHSLADAADAISTARFLATDLLVETKPDLTPVTDADRAVENAVRRMLATERPDDAVVGEETGTTGN